MKTILVSIAILTILVSCQKDSGYDPITTPSGSFPEGTSSYSKRDTLEKLAQQYAKLGIPGVVIAVYTPTDGFGERLAGFLKQKRKHGCSSLIYSTCRVLQKPTWR